jgi:hypothetical protein
MFRKLFGRWLILPGVALALTVFAGLGYARQGERTPTASEVQDVRVASSYNVYFRRAPGDRWVLWKRVSCPYEAADLVRDLQSRGYDAKAVRID